MNGVLPLVGFELSPDGTLSFTNVAVDLGAAQPASKYHVRWFAYDNRAGTATPVGITSSTSELRAEAPSALLTHGPDYVMVELRGEHAGQPEWASPLNGLPPPTAARVGGRGHRAPALSPLRATHRPSAHHYRDEAAPR